MRKISLEEIDWEIDCLPEDTPVRGNLVVSGDDDQDEADEDKVIEDLEHNPWAWCCVRVTGRWMGLEASDFLGCCSYESEADFRRSGGYYQGMQDIIRGELQQMAEKIVKEMRDEGEK